MHLQRQVFVNNHVSCVESSGVTKGLPGGRYLPEMSHCGTACQPQPHAAGICQSTQWGCQSVTAGRAQQTAPDTPTSQELPAVWLGGLGHSVCRVALTPCSSAQPDLGPAPSDCPASCNTVKGFRALALAQQPASIACEGGSKAVAAAAAAVCLACS